MQELRAWFDTITLCLKEQGASKDVRRLILIQCIRQEHKIRHSSNCIGPVYKTLCAMIMGSAFGPHRSYINSSLVESMGHMFLSYTGSGMGTLILISKKFTDFLLNNNLVPREQLTINHPAEGLAIISSAIGVSLIMHYITRQNLISHDGRLERDDGLLSLMGGGYPKGIIELFRDVLQPSVSVISNFVTTNLIAGRPRFVTAEMNDDVEQLCRYVDNLRVIHYKSPRK